MDRKETHGFILSAGRCPFLNRRGLCDIQLELGEKGLCTVCRQYPRFTETFPGRIEKGIGLSCEEAVRLLFSRKEPLRFEMVYTAEEQENGTEDEPVEEALFAVLLKARETSICILQDRSCSLGARMTALLRYAEQLQREINDNQWGKIRGLAPRLGQEPFESPLEGICCDDMEKILKVFASMEAMNDDWVKILEELCKYLCEGALGKAHYQARRKAFLRDILAY